MLETVIFSIDKAHDLHQQARFLRYVEATGHYFVC